MSGDMRIGVGLSRLEDPFAAAKAAVQDAMKAVPEPGLALVFASIHYDQQRVHEGLLSEIRPEILAGGSSYAEVSNAGVTKRSVAVLLVAMDGLKVSFVDTEIGKNSAETGEIILKGAAGFKRPENATPLGLFFASIGDGCENDVLKALRGRLPWLPVFGGLCCGDYDLGMSHADFWTNYQYLGDRVTRKGARFGLLEMPAAGRRLAFGFEHGWSPVGPPVEFTRAEGNKVFGIGGVPILDYYRQFLGQHDDKEFFELMVQRFGFSLIVGEGEQTRTVLELPVAVDFDAGAITFYPSVDLQGKRVQLIQASRQALIAGAKRAAERCKAALGDTPPALVMMVSCCTRSAILHSQVDNEARAVQEVFGENVPLFGYYSGGEIVPFMNTVEDAVEPDKPLAGSHFHTTTVALLAVGSTAAPAAIAVPARERAPAKEDPEVARLKKLLSESEGILDSTERFMANLSRKSFRDGELLKEQNIELELRNERNEKLQQVIHTYTPHDIWKKLGENVARGEYDLADAAGRFAFMFLDVKGFTAFSEKHKAAEVVEALNKIFRPATEIIYESEGDVDKYIGDCIFAAFSGPEEAVKAGRGILELAQGLREEGSPFTIRIGINAGRAVRANVGGDGRREYTYIGDAVNLAQRLESNCTPGRMLLSEAVYKAAGGAFPGAERREIQVKGKRLPVTVYECG